MKQVAEFAVDNFETFKQKMLNWANRFSIFCLLDNHQYGFQQPAFECLLGAGCVRSVTANAGNAFNQLQQFNKENKSWLFGHLGYDLKNELEQLASGHPDGIGFPDLFFFEPEIVIQLRMDTVVIHATGDPEKIFQFIRSYPLPVLQLQQPVSIQQRIDKATYLDIIEKLKTHILRGDCYEINFCQEFYAHDVVIDPLTVYTTLSTLSPNPFSALYKLEDRYCICASPERYLRRVGNTIQSQPIKGTSRRHPSDPEKDNLSRQYLAASEKEKSENTMVVDLVRNDLSRICRKGTVKVSELFGIYSFPQVHQMISTVEGEVDENTSWVDIVKATFPMGSMTGAPKKRVMELIEAYECTRRGLFSGAIGYINPAGDFDFNVIIRSILYNQTAACISYQVGGAITFSSIAGDEYAECMAKVTAITTLFNGQVPA